MKMQDLKYIVRGKMPLLMNNPSCMGTGTEGIKIVGPSDKLPPDEQAKLRVYANPDGTLYVPSEWTTLSIQYAGKGRKINKVAVSMLVPTCVFTKTDRFPILDKKGKPVTEYEVFVKPVHVGKGRILRGRPMIRDWNVPIEISIDTETINAEIIDQLLERAGLIGGWGDYAPFVTMHKRTAGPYGTFTVERVK